MGTGSQFTVNEHIKVIGKSFFAPKHESNEENMITTEFCMNCSQNDNLDI